MPTYLYLGWGGERIVWASWFPEYILMDHLQALIDPSKQFAKDSIRLVKRCTKPDRKGNTLR
ncbi:unnamed protein product [Wuchereria bancrofti]|uniref:Uncharacterized protein n=1 Tax=Wuchereria bancrofti TaxID=6293 RepID=A0A3P7F4G8_WUCBA|nr:unnamed protein product [Wuchereria bancrofti]